MKGKRARSVLITGFPERQPAVHLVRELALHGDLSVCALVAQSQQERALALLENLPVTARERVSFWMGNPRSIDLGLSGEELGILSERVEVMHHCSCVTDPAGTKEEAVGNVQSTAEILEVAEAMPRLKRLVIGAGGNFPVCALSR